MKLFRISKGVRSIVPMTAVEACERHTRGDRYANDVHMYRLHQQRVDHGPRTHFEIEPRWSKYHMPDYVVR